MYTIEYHEEYIILFFEFLEKFNIYYKIINYVLFLIYL